MSFNTKSPLAKTRLAASASAFMPLAAAMAEVNAILAKREAARIAKLDRQAEVLASAWDHVSATPCDDERHLPRVREARLVEDE